MHNCNYDANRYVFYSSPGFSHLLLGTKRCDFGVKIKFFPALPLVGIELNLAQLEPGIWMRRQDGRSYFWSKETTLLPHRSRKSSILVAQRFIKSGTSSKTGTVHDRPKNEGFRLGDSVIYWRKEFLAWIRDKPCLARSWSSHSWIFKTPTKTSRLGWGWLS